MTRKMFKKNLLEAIEFHDGYEKDEDIEKFLDLNFDEDGYMEEWTFNDFNEFAMDVCEEGLWEAAKSYDLHYEGEDDDIEDEEDNEYLTLTYEKEKSLGQIMTLKEALDLYWNSVRIKIGDKEHICYLRYDGIYELDGLSEEYLNHRICLNDEYSEDADGYPIIYATFEYQHSNHQQYVFNHIKDCWNAIKEAKTKEEIESLFKLFPRWSGDWSVDIKDGHIVVTNDWYDPTTESYNSDSETLDIDVDDDEDDTENEEKILTFEEYKRLREFK